MCLTPHAVPTSSSVSSNRSEEVLDRVDSREYTACPWRMPSPSRVGWGGSGKGKLGEVDVAALRWCAHPVSFLL